MIASLSIDLTAVKRPVDRVRVKLTLAEDVAAIHATGVETIMLGLTHGSPDRSFR